MRNLADIRIALIGGAGFIGHNLALHLCRLGADVHVIDSLQVNNLLAFSSKSEDEESRRLYLRILQERLDLLNAANVGLHIQDARDYHALGRILGRIKPSVIVQLAAVAHAGRSNKDPYSTFDHSLRTLENALDFARAEGVTQFVFLSSSMVYGNFEADEVSEDHPLNPIGIYGALKVAGEKLVIAYQQVFGLPYTIIRPSALYGPRCVSRRVGQIFIENALMGRPLRIDGDGSEKLDFTYVDDLTEGIALSLIHPGAANQTFNMTYGSARSIQELVDNVRRHLPMTSLERVKRDDLMPIRGTLCVRKASELLGYSPRVPIEVGIKRYVDWYKQLFATA